MVRIKDVAQAAGVSTATVSRVLADKPYVRPELRRRVLAAVEELKYQPSRIAQSLRAQHSQTIGLIVADIQNPYFTSVSRAVEDVAHENEMAVFYCNSDENPHKEDIYLRLMHAERVAGLIFAPTNRTASDPGLLVDPGLPLVLIDRYVPGLEVDTVVIDNFQAAYKIVAHLIADGHRRIAAMFGTGSTTGRERWEGYLQALMDHGLEAQDECARFVQAREEDGYREATRLLGLRRPPDAILASNGLLSAGAFRALRQSRVAIPDDVAFVAFDNTLWTSLVEPPVTVIEQPTYEIGRLAAELLLKRIADPGRPIDQIALKGSLLIRQSCHHHGDGASTLA